MRYCPSEPFSSESRASQSAKEFNKSKVRIIEKQNSASRMAGLVLPAVRHNRRRHDALQKFFLTNDSVTIATEVPIYLLPKDIMHMKKWLGFEIPLDDAEPIGGHIDFLQIRNGLVHILDYKPGAKKERPIGQLMIYALALSRLTGLRLFDFKCAWFDETGYYEFYPLRVVRKSKLAVVDAADRAL